VAGRGNWAASPWRRLNNKALLSSGGDTQRLPSPGAAASPLAHRPGDTDTSPAVPPRAVLDTNHLGLCHLSPSRLCFSSPVYHKPSGLFAQSFPFLWGLTPFSVSAKQKVPGAGEWESDEPADLKHGTSVPQDFIRKCPSKSRGMLPPSPGVSRAGHSMTSLLCDVQIKQPLSRSREIFFTEDARGRMRRTR